MYRGVEPPVETGEMRVQSRLLAEKALLRHQLIILRRQTKRPIYRKTDRLLLVALASCAGMDIITILRKKRQDVSAYEIRVHGVRVEEYPKAFVKITVEHIFTGHALQSEAVQRAIDLTEEKYCGASAMLGKTATIAHTYHLIEAA